MARLHTETIPTSTLASTARVVDGFVTTQADHQGITGSFTRAYTATGITQTATVYDAAFDAPSVITNAQGKTACYKYDQRGRKVAEWGTAIQSPRRLVGGLAKCVAFAPQGRGRNGVRPRQSDRGLGESLDKRAAFARRARSRGAAPSQPALFSYDDADNLTALTTFRADSGDITTDATGRTDGDTTTWAYHPTAGVELSKTYADNSQVVKTYDAFNRPATETNARGIVKTLSYDAATRPLGIRKDVTWYTYGWDLTKNICEVFSSGGTILTAYTYTPYGAVAATGNVTQSPRRLVGGLDKCAVFAPQGRAADGAAPSQPIQWSSEYNDTELGLAYYNYRHYNPADGRWTGRDLVAHALTDDSVYTYVKNVPAAYIDQLGLRPTVGDSGFLFIIHLCNSVCGNDNGEVIPPSVEHPAGSYTGYSKDVDDVIPGLSEKLYEAIINKHKIPEYAAFGRNKKSAHYIDAQVREYVTSVRHSLPWGAKKLDDFMTRNTYDFTSVLFAIGKATVATK